jgi:hypothetical protein
MPKTPPKEHNPARQASPSPKPEQNNDDEKTATVTPAEDGQNPETVFGPGAGKFGRGKRVPKPRTFFNPACYQPVSQKKTSNHPHPRLTPYSPPPQCLLNTVSFPEPHLPDPKDSPIQPVEDDFYEVHRIIGFRMRKDEKEWLVEWVGYPNTKATWKNEKALEREMGYGGFKEYRRELLRELVGREKELVEWERAAREREERKRTQLLEMFDEEIEHPSGYVQVEA